MAKPTKRWFQDRDLLEDAIGDTGEFSGASLPSPGAGVLRGLLPPLFTVKPDNVNFNLFKAGHYDPASYYAALESSDTVVLPLNQANADAIGYDATRTFQAGLGNDTVTGGGLNDLIYGGHGNDRLYGNNGNDALMGGEGHDWLIGAKGNDLLWAGNGIDYIEAGAGNDIIVANDDDRFLHPGQWAPSPMSSKSYTDHIEGGAGNDHIFATSLDEVNGGDGDDRIELSVLTDSLGYAPVAGENGNDVIIGSENADLIYTGPDEEWWAPTDWNAENKAAYGGFTDTVVGGEGNDELMTMMYCTAIVDAGANDDAIHVLGVRDVISMGEGNDMLRLYGGTCKADLGAGDDLFVMSRAAYDNPTVSEITLGEGADKLIFNTTRWLTEGNDQPLSEAPWILDFDPRFDRIERIDVFNRPDPSKTLDPRNIFAINIESGSALIYDDPVDSSNDFCFARFAGVGADALKAHVDMFTEFYYYGIIVDDAP